MNELHVIFKLAGSEYAIAAEEVFQMDTFSGAVPVPGAASYVAGLVHVRQQIAPVLDLRLRFGLPKVLPSLESRVIVLKRKERLIGLLVDSAREVQKIHGTQMQATPEVTSRQATGFVKAVAQLDKRIIMILDSEKVVNEESLHG